MAHTTSVPLLNGHHRPRKFLPKAILLLLAKPQGFEHHDELRQSTRKLVGHLVLVLLQHRRACVLSDVEGLVEREPHRDRPVDLYLADILLVDQQHSSGRLADPAAGIVELDADDMIAGRKRLIRGNAIFMLWLIREGVCEKGLAVLDHEHPAAVT